MVSKTATLGPADGDLYPEGHVACISDSKDTNAEGVELAQDGPTLKRGIARAQAAAKQHRS